MKNKVYGILGFGEIHANFNADNDAAPRMDNMGRFYASEESVKYAIKDFWREQNPDSVFAIKTNKVETKGEEVTISPKKIEERYESLFGPIPKKGINQAEIYSNLLSMNDLINFGIVFTAIKSCNMSFRGAVHITKPINKVYETSVIVENKLTPYANSNKDDSVMTTLGRKQMVDEAHKFCDFDVNPNNLNDVKEFGEYKEENYEAFKEGALCGISNMSTTTKKGCYNEFGMFIKMKENTYRNLNRLTPLLDFTLGIDDKNVINISRIMKRLIAMDEFIEDIEIYFDEETIILEGVEKTNDKIKIFDITTRERYNFANGMIKK